MTWIELLGSRAKHAGRERRQGAGDRGGDVVDRKRLLAVDAVVGAEIDRTVALREPPGVRTDVRLGFDVVQHHGAGGGAVAPPNLVAVGPVVGGENNQVAQSRQLAGVPPVGARENVLTIIVPSAVPSLRHNSAGTVEPIVGHGQVEHAADVHQTRRTGALGAGNDVLDHHGTGGTAVARPELAAVAAGGGDEIELSAGNDQLGGIEPAAPGLMSFTWEVPAGVPSLDHSSMPLVPSSAAK